MRKLLVLTLFALMSVLSAYAYDFEVDGIYYAYRGEWNDEYEWEIIDGEVEVTYRDYNDNSYSGSVVIPATVTYDGKTYAVTSIGYEAFQGCTGLTSITIPESVTYIGGGAFYQCSGLTSVTIPNSVTSIGTWAFRDCSGLAAMTIPESVTSIGESAFSGTAISNPLYNSKIFAYMPQDYNGAYTIPSGIQTIANTAFGNTEFGGCYGLTSVTIPNSVTSIGYAAFAGCSGLTSVTIPNSVTSIGYVAFAYCSGLTSVTIPESVTSVGDDQRHQIYSIFYGCSGLTSVEWNAVSCQDFEYAYERPFYGCENITSITFGERVEHIPSYLCYNQSGLTSVTIPNSVTSIGDYAFDETSISSPVYNSKVFAYMPKTYSGEYAIPSGIQWIVGGAFKGCGNLKSVTIPEGVDTIRESTFYNCSGLTSVVWNARHCGDFSYYTRPFADASLTSITFGSEVEHIPSYLCYSHSGLTSVTIPESVISIGNYTFYGCSGLTSVTIPESVTSIGYGCFSSCSGLTSVTIPEGVNTLRDYIFYSCSSLTSVTIPNSVTTIGKEAFYGCSGLTSVTIGRSVTTIGESAFSGCSGLTSVTIPESVTSIGYGCFSSCSSLTSVKWNAIACQDFRYSYDPFYGCENITSITFGNQVERIPAYLCYSLSGLTSVTIPESVTSIGNYAFYGCSGLTSVTIGKSVTSIGGGAFHGCSGLTSVTIPNSVTSIGEAAFRACSGLTSVTIPESVTSIGKYAFYDCSGLTSVTIGKSVTSIGNDAFSGCSGLTSVKSLAEMPSSCDDDTFGDNDYYPIPLYVPAGSKPFYTVAHGWRKFAKIEEFEANTYTVTAQPNDAAMGTVTGGGEYKEGEQAMLAAIPYPGHYFAKWDDGNTNNPRILAVSGDTTITAIFAKNGDNPTANENSEAENFGVYVQNRTIYLSEYRGSVQVYNVAGQCVYNGHATAIPVQQPGVYILRVADGRSCKVLVR